MLSGQDFYHKLYGAIFDTMVSMSNEGQKIDIVTVFENLKKNTALADSISTDDLRNLAMGVPTSANIKQYAGIVHDKAILRNIIRVNEEIAGECYAGNMETDDILNNTEQKIFKLIQSKGQKDVVPFKQLVYEVVNKAHQASKYPDDVSGIPT